MNKYGYNFNLTEIVGDFGSRIHAKAAAVIEMLGGGE